MKAGKPERARAALERIGSADYADRILREIAHTLEKDNNKVSYGALLAPRVKPIVIIGMVLAIFQQWCGINVIFNYAQEIFASAGFDINSTLKSIVATGVVNLVFTIAALPLVDKIGRRKLMLLGASGLTLIYVLIAGAYAMGIMGWPVLLLVLAAIAIYALTLAPVTWVLLAEIFPNRVRGLAMSLGTLALWIACFLLTYTFPLLNAGLGAAGSFLLYGVICAAGYLYILRNVRKRKVSPSKRWKSSWRSVIRALMRRSRSRCANGGRVDSGERASADVRLFSGRQSAKFILAAISSAGAI